jgi:hypothetical protein
MQAHHPRRVTSGCPSPRDAVSRTRAERESRVAARAKCKLPAPAGGGTVQRVWVRIRRYEPLGLVVKPILGQAFTVTYGEILTAERLPARRGIRLHTRTTAPVRIAARGRNVAAIEADLRARGVRIVDCWGCLLTPTLADFEEALDLEPVAVRQSSDNA